MNHVDFRRANLQGANLSDCDLVEAFFARAVLTGANLSSANLIRAELMSAKMERVNLQGATMPDGKVHKSRKLRG